MAGKILKEEKAGDKVKLVADSSFWSKKGSGLMLSREHWNTINRVGVIYHYLRELLYKHT